VNDNKTAKALKIVGLATLIGAICFGLAFVVYAVGGAALRTGNFSGVVILIIIALAAWGLSLAKGKSK
jgi:formate/nitrite transporter FocA (FNT family)